MARERGKYFDIPPILGFYPTLMALKACFHPTALPSPMVGKEKVKDGERSEEYKSNQLTKRMGERVTDEGEDQK